MSEASIVSGIQDILYDMKQDYIGKAELAEYIERLEALVVAPAPVSKHEATIDDILRGLGLSKEGKAGSYTGERVAIIAEAVVKSRTYEMQQQVHNLREAVMRMSTMLLNDAGRAADDKEIETIVEGRQHL